MPSTHHPLSPSGWERWSTCPGSVDMERGLAGESSEAATEGTIAHEVFELSMLVSEQPSRCWQSVRRAVPEMGDLLDPIYSAAQSLIQPGDRVFIEKCLTLRDRDGKALLFGTCDLCIVRDLERLIHVLDLKYGKHDVSPESGQLRIYALAARDTLVDWTPRKYHTTVLQPRGSGLPVRSAEYSQRQMYQFRQQVEKAVAATSEINPEIVPGHHCFFCKAHEECEVRRQYAIDLDFADLDVGVGDLQQRVITVG